MAITFISEISVTPDAASNLGALLISCVVRDATDAVLSSNNTCTAIITRSDGTAITNSPVTLSAGSGRYSGAVALTAQAGVGVLNVQIKNVNTTTSSVTVYSKSVKVRTVDDTNSMGVY